jgi:TRAP-type C4-dicarboxylate transport system permease small subunit
VDTSAAGAGAGARPVDGRTATRAGDPLSSWATTAGGWAAGLCLAAIVGIGAVQVCFRYLLNAPLPWPEEVARLLLVWLTYLGALAVPESRLHVTVDALYERLPRRARRGADVLSNLLGLTLHGALVVGGVGLVAATAGIRLPALQLPLGLLVGVLPVTAALQVYLHGAAVVRACRMAAAAPGHER